VSSTSTAAVNIAGALNVGGQSSSIAAGDISAARSTTSGYINMGTDGAVYFGRTAGAVVLGGASFAWGSGLAITSSDSVALLAGATFTGAITAPASSSFTTDLKVLGAQAGDATLDIWSDAGDDSLDQWSLVADATNNRLSIYNAGANIVTLIAEFRAQTNQFRMTDSFNGSAAEGPSVYLERSVSTGNAPGTFVAEDASGVPNYLWVQATGGKLRINAASGATPTTGDAIGTVVGDQTSLRSAKNIHGRWDSPINNAEALRVIVNAPLWEWDFKNGAYGGQRFIGITLGKDSAENANVFGMDRDEENPWGRSLNEITLHGYELAAIKELERRLAVAEAELATLKGHK
jgi:hypothetical protein